MVKTMEPRTVESLEPLVSECTRALVLGSMPGDLSLKLSQYYAHPRNRFWQVMAALSGIDPLSKREITRFLAPGEIAS